MHNRVDKIFFAIVIALQLAAAALLVHSTDERATLQWQLQMSETLAAQAEFAAQAVRCGSGFVLYSYGVKDVAGLDRIARDARDSMNVGRHSLQSRMDSAEIYI